MSDLEATTEKAPLLGAPAEIEGARGAITEPRWVRVLLIGSAMLFLGLFLIVPLVAVFAHALAKGLGTYLSAIADPESLSAIRLTLIAASIAVPLNLVFGLAAS